MRLAWLPALALLAPGCHARPGIEAHPALWMARDADTTIWLFGTVHVLPPNVRWRTPAIAAAIDGSDSLILEIADNPPALFRRMAMSPGLPPILARVPPGERGALVEAAARAGETLGSLDAMKSWGAALALAFGAAEAGGATADDAPEAVLTRRFAADGKPRGALETAAGQFAAFDSLPEAAQRVLLAQAIAGDDARATLAAWAAGDTARLAAAIAPGRSASPTLDEEIVIARNRRWAAAIARRMARPGRLFVAVGAGHLVGAGSVIAMLREAGIKVERVE